jgi:hypothetical protein
MQLSLGAIRFRQNLKKGVAREPGTIPSALFSLYDLIHQSAWRNCLEILSHGPSASPSNGSSRRRRMPARLSTASRNLCSSSCSERARRKSSPPPTCGVSHVSSRRHELLPVDLLTLLGPLLRPKLRYLLGGTGSWVACVRSPRSRPKPPRPTSCPCPRIPHPATSEIGARAHPAPTPVRA